MTEFSLDTNKRFPENCADFLEGVTDLDPEMAEILKANWDKLIAVVHRGERDTKSRTAFNEIIAEALDGLLTQDVAAEDE